MIDLVGLIQTYPSLVGDKNYTMMWWIKADDYILLAMVYFTLDLLFCLLLGQI